MLLHSGPGRQEAKALTDYVITAWSLVLIEGIYVLLMWEFLKILKEAALLPLEARRLLKEF